MAFNNKIVGRYPQRGNSSAHSFHPVSNAERKCPLPMVIRNLAVGTTEEQVRRVFSNYGKLVKIFMIFDHAFIQMDTPTSSETAKRELDGKCFRGQIIRVNYATSDTTTTTPTTTITPAQTTRRKGNVVVSVKHLSPMVSNELLKESFSIFGVVNRAVVIADSKGQSTTRGIVTFHDEETAQKAIQQIQEGSFLVTSSPRPISASLMEEEDCDVGLPEVKLPKSPQYYSERKALPRFAESGTFEELCANTWKVRYNLEREQREQFEKNIEETRAVFESEIENCRKTILMKQDMQLNPVKREVLEEQRKNEAQERKQNETARADEHNKKMTENEHRQKILGNQIEKQMSTSMVVASSSRQSSGPTTSSNGVITSPQPSAAAKKPTASTSTPGSSKSDKKRFKCPQCPKRYSHSCNLTTHMRIHDKERQVKCEICSKLFATKHQYMSHMISHSSTKNRKKFQLQIRARCQQQQLEASSKYLKCLECRGGGRYFRTPEALSVHMATLHKSVVVEDMSRRRRGGGPDISFHCVYCDEKFTESEALRLHVTTHTENKYKFN